MTQNQLQRQANIEAARANLVREKQNQQSIEEAYRHNRQNEIEQQRHNVMTENLQREANTINQTHLQRQDLTSLYSAQTTAAHQERSDAENIKHNRITEAITSNYNTEMADIGHINATANIINANTKQKEYTLNAKDVATRQAAQQSRSALEGAQVTNVNEQTKYVGMQAWGNVLSGIGNLGLQAYRVYAGMR